MKNIKYIFALSLKNIIRFKVINLTIFIISIFAFTMIGIYTAHIIGWIEQNQSQIQFRDSENVRLVMIYEPDDFDKLKGNAQSGSFEYIKPAKQDRVVYDKKYISDTEISVVSKNYIDIYANLIFDGTYIKNPSNECLISLSLSDNYNINIGESITVGSIDFNVVGITTDSHNQIIIQNELAVQGFVYPFQIYTNNSSLDNTYKNKIMIGETKIQEFFDIKTNDSLSIVIYTTIIIYAILSLINIVIFYKYKIATSMLTQYFLGATHKHIFLQRFFENLIIFTIATFVSYGITHIAAKYLAKYLKTIPYLTNLNVLVILEIFAVIIAAFFSIAIMFKIKRGVR